MPHYPNYFDQCQGYLSSGQGDPFGRPYAHHSTSQVHMYVIAQKLLYKQNHIRFSRTKPATRSRAAPSSALFLPPPCADSGLPPPLPPKRWPTTLAILPAWRPRLVNAASTLTCTPTRSPTALASTTTPAGLSLARTISPNSRKTFSSG